MHSMSKVARWLAVLVLLAMTSACMDTYYCGVPQGDNVNILGDQDNR
jgi:hypothetical protein